MDSEEDIDVAKIIQLHKQKVQEKWDYYKKFQSRDNIIKNLEYEIYKNCKHEWELDYSGCSPHDGPDRVCKICRLYRNDYLYTKR